MRRPRLRCAYCGWTPAKRRRQGEPATCAMCADLPRLESPDRRAARFERKLELEPGDELEPHRDIRSEL